MSKLKILIVEDDPLIADSLKDILNVLGHEAVGIAPDANTAIEICNQNELDLALLDIQIGGDMDGVDLAEVINDDYDIPFVFTTAFADNVTVKRAKDRGPFGYVVKPYGTKDINAAIEVAMDAFKRLKEAEEKVETPKIVDFAIFLKVDSKLIRVPLEDLLYVEAKGDYALFKTREKGYIVHSTMKNAQEKLRDYNFQKVHRSFVVNLAKIKDIEESNMLIEDKVIPISRANKEALMKRLNLF